LLSVTVAPIAANPSVKVTIRESDDPS
jgi:hypothetical protein